MSEDETRVVAPTGGPTPDKFAIVPMPSAAVLPKTNDEVSTYTQTMLQELARGGTEHIRRSRPDGTKFAIGHWMLVIDGAEGMTKLVIPYSYKPPEDVWVNEQIYPIEL